MKAIALAIIALWIAAGFGQTMLHLLIDAGQKLFSKENTGAGAASPNPQYRTPNTFLHFVYAAALGFGIASYGTFALGWLGFLRFWPVTLWWIVLALIGLPGMIQNGKDAIAGRKTLFPHNADGGKAERIFCVCAALVVLFCGAVAVLACFVPPNGLEWDALAYHLADPKVFLQMGRIVSLPTEHHSNFPLTMETLYAVGLLYDGYALANLFHFLMGTLTVLAILGFCHARFSPVVGWAAALIFVTTPVVLWEAGTAYIELGFGLYATLSALAAISIIEAQSASLPNTQRPTYNTLLAGSMMGFALGMKYLALLPFVFVGILLLWRRVPVKQIAVYAGMALLFGSPWYLKNAAVTGNPVYPFAYSVFPHSKYWSADRAKMYQGEQDHFGEIHSPNQPAVAAQNMLLAPLRLLTDAGKTSNPGEYTFMALIGGLYGAFTLALLLQKKKPSSISSLLILAGLQLIAWFLVAQISRYLVAVLPLLAICCGYMVWKLGFAKNFLPVMRVTVLAALGGQVAILLWGLFVLPVSARDAMRNNSMPTALSVPDALAIVTAPDGAEKHQRRTLDIYDAMDWMNRNTPKDAGVVLYDNVLGFYLDRPYLWGNAQHSSYIPYGTLTNGKQLTGWLKQKGFRYALFNLNLARPAYDPTGAQFPAGPNRNEEAALRKWYGETPFPPGDWRLPLQDAIRTGQWRTVYAKNGVIALEMQ